MFNKKGGSRGSVLSISSFFGPPRTQEVAGRNPLAASPLFPPLPHTDGPVGNQTTQQSICIDSVKQGEVIFYL